MVVVATAAAVVLRCIAIATTVAMALTSCSRQSPKFVQFVTTCCRAFNVIRRHRHRFVSLFHLMLSTGMPELQVIQPLAQPSGYNTNPYLSLRGTMGGTGYNTDLPELQTSEDVRFMERVRHR